MAGNTWTKYSEVCSKKHIEREMEAPEEAQEDPALANYKDTHVVLTGGLECGDRASDYAAYYDVQKDEWTDLYSL